MISRGNKIITKKSSQTYDELESLIDGLLGKHSENSLENNATDELSEYLEHQQHKAGEKYENMEKEMDKEHLSQENESLRTCLQQAITTVQNTRKQLDQYGDVLEDNSRLKSQLEAANEKLIEKENICRESHLSKDTIANGNSELLENLRSSKDIIATQNNMMVNNNLTIGKMKNNLEELAAENERLSKELQEYKNSVTHSDYRNKEVVNLNNFMSDLNYDSQRISTDLEKELKKQKSLYTELQALKSETITILSQKEEYMKEMSLVKKENEDLLGDLKKIQEKKAKLTAKNVEEKNKLAALQKEEMNLQRQAIEAKKATDDFYSQLQEKNREIATKLKTVAHTDVETPMGIEESKNGLHCEWMKEDGVSKDRETKILKELKEGLEKRVGMCHDLKSLQQQREEIAADPEADDERYKQLNVNYQLQLMKAEQELERSKQHNQAILTQTRKHQADY